MADQQPGRDYALGGSSEMDRFMRERQAGIQAAFLLPHLSPGMSLVDVGCGQGTITAGLARVLAPGSVVGFDAQEEHIQSAEKTAASEGLTNLSFRLGNIFEAPFEPESFDLAYANAVVSHLASPEAGILAIGALVRHDGLLAVRDRGGDPVYGGPVPDVMKRIGEVFQRTIDLSSSNPGSQSTGAVMNKICREAGFHVLQMSASWEFRLGSAYGPAGTRHPLTGPMGKRAIQLGLTTQEELSQIVRTFETEWVPDPDAFMAIPWFEVVARKP
jgi:SAM-dependent methyltransferase